MECDTPLLVYLVDDDGELCERTCAFLNRNGFSARGFLSIGELRTALDRRPCDVLLLDIMLPDEDGLSFFRSYRTREKAGRVVFVSALGDETSRVMGLELGADDYLVKPFSLRELAARIRNAARRRADADDRPCVRYEFAGWSMEPRARLLTAPDGVVRNLSGAEYRLLKAFLENPMRVLERDALYRIINRTSGEGNDRVLEVRISRLRACLNESARTQRLIRTSRGDGYLLAAEVVKIYADHD